MNSDRNLLVRIRELAIQALGAGSQESYQPGEDFQYISDLISAHLEPTVTSLILTKREIDCIESEVFYEIAQSRDNGDNPDPALLLLSLKLEALR